jgi:proline-specific peptidase
MQAQTFSKPDGATLGYLSLGEPSAPLTLVCHPGGPGMSASYFGDLCGLPSDEVRVILLDPRGAGASDRPDDGGYELEGYAADLDALRVHLGLERINLLGHSHGGFVSLTYALNYRDGLDRLVLVCTAARFSDELRQEAEAAIAAHSEREWYADAIEAQRRRQTWQFDTSEEAAALYAKEFRLSFADDAPEAHAFLRELAEQRPNLDALRYFNERLAPSYDLRPRLSEIHAPTLILNGAEDYFGPRVSARELSAIPGSEVVMLPSAGHWPFIETPERFRTELGRFLGLASLNARRFG